MLRRRRGRGLPWAFCCAPVRPGRRVLALFTALSNLESGQSAEARAQLEDAIHRAVVSCYATEGFYPPTLDYVEEYYGIQIDSSRYAVFYEIFAENLMPDITVLELGEAAS